MRKSYKLLKDLPDVLAGAKFTLGEATDAYFLTSDKTGTNYNCYTYPKDWVEQNKEWFEEIKDKEWEILSFETVKGGAKFCLLPNGEYGILKNYSTGVSLHSMLHLGNCVDSGCFFIQSVKRISDGEIFSVGDYLWHTPFVGSSSFKVSIKNFYIDNDVMFADFTTEDSDYVWAYSLNGWVKYVEKKYVPFDKSLFTHLWFNSNPLCDLPKYESKFVIPFDVTEKLVIEQWNSCVYGNPDSINAVRAIIVQKEILEKESKSVCQNNISLKIENETLKEENKALKNSIIATTERIKKLTDILTNK